MEVNRKKHVKKVQIPSFSALFGQIRKNRDVLLFFLLLSPKRTENGLCFLKIQLFFFSPARDTGTERRPKAGAEWRCPTPEKKKKQLNFQEAKPIFVFSETDTKKKQKKVCSLRLGKKRKSALRF